VKAVISTARGRIELELFDDKTPNTVKNFAALARKGFYNGLKFHRVIANFMIQAGCPRGDGTGDAGSRSDCEIVPGVKHAKGAISMAHAGTCKHDPASGVKTRGSCSNGSQFFITHVATPHLDGVHTVFGKVVTGQEVVDATRQGDVMASVEIVEG
jgi:peptidyl-prolyl cis-trans isomerase B (cyclophilin B)